MTTTFRSIISKFKRIEYVSQVSWRQQLLDLIRTTFFGKVFKDAEKDQNNSTLGSFRRRERESDASKTKYLKEKLEAQNLVSEKFRPVSMMRETAELKALTRCAFQNQ